MSLGFSPSPTESDPCGSKSTSRTLRPYSASAAPRLIVVVVLPTPPFWLHIAIVRALPWIPIGRGSGSSGQGRPVGPRGGSARTRGGSARTRGGSAGAGASGAAGAATARCGNGIAGACVPGVATAGTAEALGGAGVRTRGGISGALEPPAG